MKIKKALDIVLLESIREEFGLIFAKITPQPDYMLYYRQTACTYNKSLPAQTTFHFDTAALEGYYEFTVIIDLNLRVNKCLGRHCPNLYESFIVQNHHLETAFVKTMKAAVRSIKKVKKRKEHLEAFYDAIIALDPCLSK